MTPERKPFQPLLPDDVCQVYELLYSNKLVSFPHTQPARGRVDGIVSNILATYYNHELYPTWEEKAVAYLYFLIKDHPFIDGNKRTATLTFSVACDMNDLIPQFGGDRPSLDELAVFIESIQEEDHQRVIRLIANVLFVD